MRTHPKRGSHLPVLIKVIARTSGTVLEFGCGMYSSPYLHWACFPERKLITYEDHDDWRGFIEQFKAPWHEIIFTKEWGSVEIPMNDVSVALVDHNPVSGRKRAEDVARLRHVDYVVCHDSENKSDRNYKYSTIYDLFKHRRKFEIAGTPSTTVFSNKHELNDL